jgi:hypothetical protein
MHRRDGFTGEKLGFIIIREIKCRMGRDAESLPEDE